VQEVLGVLVLEVLKVLVLKVLVLKVLVLKVLVLEVLKGLRPSPHQAMNRAAPGNTR